MEIVNKKKILILSRFVKEYEPVRLKEEAEKAGFEADIIKYGQITFGVKNGKSFINLPNDKKLSDYFYIIPRAASKKGSSMVAVKNVVLEEARKLGIKILNDTTFTKYPLLGKMEQGSLLAANNIPTIDYLSFGSKNGFEEFIESIHNSQGTKNKQITNFGNVIARNEVTRQSQFSFPLIIKGRFGSHGRTVKVANNIIDLKSISKKYSGDTVLIQPLLNIKQWYRCIVVKNNIGEYEYLGSMRHRQKEKYSHTDYSYVDKPLTKLNSQSMTILNNICIQAAKLFECDYCGIDVLYNEDTKSFVVSEVNRTAQFKYFEKRVGVNIAQKLVK